MLPNAVQTPCVVFSEASECPHRRLPFLRPIGIGDRDAECDSKGRLEASESIFSRNRVEPAAPPVVFRDGSLRQRGGAAAPVEIEESLLQPDQDAPVRGDSMSLFATLVPPPLRKSKKNFTSGEADRSCGRINSRMPAKKGVPRCTFLHCFRLNKARGDTDQICCAAPPSYCPIAP